MIATATSQSEMGRSACFEDRCPFYPEAEGVCRASSSFLLIDSSRRSRLCASDDHDRCAIFLAKTLRAESPVVFTRQNRDLEEK